MFFKNKKINKEQELKIDLLIDSGYKQLELHNKIHNSLNKKIMWFFTIISTIESYLLIDIFFTHKYLNYNLYIVLFFIILILLGLGILGHYVYLLKLKTFHTGPNILKQTNSFWSNDKSLFGLKYDTLATLNESYKINDKNIGKIGKGFSLSLILFSIYFILIIFYFLITNNMSDEDFSEYNEPPTHSENTGKVDKTYNPKK